MNVAFATRFHCENEKRMFFRIIKKTDFFYVKMNAKTKNSNIKNL